MLVTASAFSLPDLMWGSSTGTSNTPICTCPPSRSFTAGAAPLYGMWTRLMPALRIHRQQRIYREDFRHPHHCGNERKVPRRVVWHLRHGKRRDRDGRRAVQHQRVAVGRRFGGALDAEHPANAADILDHDRLAELRAHALGEKAPEYVGRAARGERYDQPDRLRGIGLRKGGRRQQQRAGAEEHPDQLSHACYRAFREKTAQMNIAFEVAAGVHGLPESRLAG